MKVAFATLDGRHVHGDLRRAPLLVIYEVRGDGFRLDRVSSFEEGAHRSQDRIQAVADVSVVYVAATGPSTAARLAARGVRAGTAPEGTAIGDVLVAMVDRLAAVREPFLSCG